MSDKWFLEVITSGYSVHFTSILPSGPILHRRADVGSHRPSMQGAHRTSSSTAPGEAILFPVFSGPPKEQGIETTIRAQMPKHLCEITEI